MENLFSFDVFLCANVLFDPFLKISLLKRPFMGVTYWRPHSDNQGQTVLIESLNPALTVTWSVAQWSGNVSALPVLHNNPQCTGSG